MAFCRARPSVSAQGSRSSTAQSKKKSVVADFEDLLQSRDYTGAITFLHLKHRGQVDDVKSLEWLAYCHFHNGEYDKALDLYNRLLTVAEGSTSYHTFASACLYYMGLYADSAEAAAKGPECPLQTRILLHLAYKQKKDETFLKYSEKLEDNVEDKLSLAAIQFSRAQYQEAIDIYKQLLLSHRDWLALNVYIALCYYSMDYHDVSLEVLNTYLQAHTNSTIATNLKSIKTYCGDSEEFHWNYAMAKAMVGAYEEAEDCLLQISYPEYTHDCFYQALLSHCFIMNGKAHMSWEQFRCLETSDDSLRSVSFGVYLAQQTIYHSRYAYWRNLFKASTRVKEDLIFGNQPAINLPSPIDC